MRAITVVIAPVVYNAVYDLSTRTPWLPTGTVWYLIALVGGLLPELLHRSMATEEVLPSAKWRCGVTHEAEPRV